MIKVLLCKLFNNVPVEFKLTISHTFIKKTLLKLHISIYNTDKRCFFGTCLGSVLSDDAYLHIQDNSPFRFDHLLKKKVGLFAHTMQVLYL